MSGSALRESVAGHEPPEIEHGTARQNRRRRLREYSETKDSPRVRGNLKRSTEQPNSPESSRETLNGTGTLPQYIGKGDLRQSIGYIKTIQRRGNTYMIRDSLPSEEDPVESDGVDRMIEDLYTETLHMSSSSGRKAGLFKIFYVLATIFVTISGAVIGVLTLEGYESCSSLYIAAVLGFMITAIQTLLSTFSIEKRSVLLKDVSNKLRRISRELKVLQNSEINPKKKMVKLEEFYAEVDELDISIFDNTITTSSVRDGTNISHDNKRSSSDINYNSGDEFLYGPDVRENSSEPKPRRGFLSRLQTFSAGKKKKTELPLTVKDLSGGNSIPPKGPVENMGVLDAMAGTIPDEAQV